MKRRHLYLPVLLFTLALLAPVALAYSPHGFYIAELYCNGSLVAVGIVGLQGVFAYPPIAHCDGGYLLTGKALEATLEHGVRIAGRYVLAANGVRLVAVLYPGRPGSYILPVLYAILLVLVALAVLALMHREELELL